MKRRPWVAGLVCAVLALGNMACSSDDESSTPEPTATGMPSKDQLAAGWNVMEPGGDTKCARGGEFVFFARGGTEDKIVIEFQDGGACWSASSCAEDADMFDPDVDRDYLSGTLTGIHDYDNPQNPYRNWSHVFVPYCTGDLHLGDKTTSYGDYSIEHRGAVNGRAAVDWIYENFDTPERVVVTGYSAGGYGSLAWAPHIMDHYDGVPVVQLADSAAGVAPPAFMLIIDGVWNTALITPSFVPGLANADLATLTLPEIYRANAAHFSSQQFAQYNSNYDSTQIRYYEDMEGDAADWSPTMNAGLAATSAAADNFACYVAADYEHTIIDEDLLYSVETSGVMLVDWVSDHVAGNSVDDVHCEPDCGAPEAE